MRDGYNGEICISSVIDINQQQSATAILNQHNRNISTHTNLKCFGSFTFQHCPVSEIFFGVKLSSDLYGRLNCH